MSEFDFVVEHKARSKIGHVDTLSRHVSAVIDEGILNKERIFHDQRRDAFCIKTKLGIYSSRSDFFWTTLVLRIIADTRLPTDKHQLMVPKTLIYDVIKANHSAVYIAHPGMKRALDLISLGYWWPGMRKSIEDYIGRCDPFQRRKEDRECVAPLGKVEEPTSPLRVTYLDTTGPYLMALRRSK